MCLIAFALGVDPEYPLVVAANRDEFYSRATSQAHFWPDAPGLLAGRDEEACGTWLGITTGGRFAALTNVRSSVAPPADALSRGGLVADFLTADVPAERYLGQVTANRARYAGYNLLVGSAAGMYYTSNLGETQHRELSAGIYGLSNHLLNTPWPKVLAARQAMQSSLRAGRLDRDALFSAFAETRAFADRTLPDTGVGLVRERELAPAFVATESYGTRCTTVVTVSRAGAVTFEERTFDDVEEPVRTFEFRLTPASRTAVNR